MDRDNIYPHFHIIQDSYNKAFRVWRSSDPGDQFTMIPFNTDAAGVVASLLLSFPTSFKLGFPQNDAGEYDCHACVREMGVL